MEEADEDLRAQPVPGRQAHAHEHKRGHGHRRKAQPECVLGERLPRAPIGLLVRREAPHTPSNMHSPSACLKR